MSRRWTLDRVMRYLIAVLAVVALLWILNYLSGVLFPFFAAFLLAYILDPLVSRLQSKVKHRIVAVIIVLLALTVIVAGAGMLFVPRVIEEVRHLGELIPRMFSDSTWVARISTFMPTDLWQTIRSMISWDKVAVAMRSLDFWQSVQSVAGKVLPGALGILSKTSNVLAWLSGAAVIVMYLIFIMLDMPKLRRGVRNMLPKRFQERSSEFAQEMDHFMGSYFRAQSLVALSVGVLYAIGFSIIGLPMGVAFGLFSGALNMVPYLQLTTIPIALLLAVVYALDSGMPFWEVALIVLAVYAIVQVVQDMFLVPKIVGSSMDLPPVGILLSLSIWGKLLGFLGLIVAIPFTCLCLVYLKKIQERADKLEAAEDEPRPEA